MGVVGRHEGPKLQRILLFTASNQTDKKITKLEGYSGTTTFFSSSLIGNSLFWNFKSAAEAVAHILNPHLMGESGMCVERKLIKREQ